MAKRTTEKAGLLWPIKGRPRRREWGVVDIESKAHGEDGERSQKGGFERPFLAGYYDGLEYVSFAGDDCCETMLAFLLSPKLDGMTYYAHYGGSFDWLHFLPALAKSGYSFEILTVQSKIQCLRVKPSKESKKKGWTFLDSYQLIPTALAKAAVALKADVTKQEGFDYDTPEDDERWKSYLQDDCIALYKTLLNFYDLVEEKLGGEVGITTAATAMKTFRRRFQQFPIHRHEKHHELFRAAYYGGRVEIYKERGERLRYYDINSSYPHSMLNAMPVGEAVEFEGEPPVWIHRNGERIGFARARVHVPLDTQIPVLPYREKGGKLLFPVGSFDGAWPAVELFAAIERGVKVEWGASVWIDALPVFADMVRTLYAYRDPSLDGFDEALSYIAKLMSNSLYGKFATNTEREKIIFVGLDDDPPEHADSVDPYDPACCIYRLTEEIDAPYIAPQIAAHITALSRLHLLRIMEESNKDGGLAYCDTDSVIGARNLSHLCSTGLGALKDEGLADALKRGVTVPSEGVLYTGEFLQPKLYRLTDNIGGDKIVMKGYQTRTPASFEAAKRGESLTFKTLEKIGGMVRKGFREGPVMKEITRMVRGEDSKRIHHPDGSTSPIIIMNTTSEGEQFWEEETKH